MNIIRKCRCCCQKTHTTEEDAKSPQDVDKCDFCREREQVGLELAVAALPFASFLRNVPQTEGGAIERIVMVSDVIRLRNALARARDLGMVEERHEGKGD